MSKSKVKQVKLVEHLNNAVLLLDAAGAAKAYSLLDWHSRRGSWTQKQENFAGALVRMARPENARKRKAKERPHFLYAISDGVAVKLGFSCNPESRARDMQTGHPTKLRVLWRMEVGSSKAQASQAERKLHRFCSRYHKRGEWFSIEAMNLVHGFVVKPTKQERRAVKKQSKAEIAEREIVAEARARI